MAGVMKDSEVEWIGEIPEGWDISKVKYVGRYINGYAFKPDQWGQDGLPIIRIQNLSGSSKSINYFDGKISDDYLIDDGDILISWSATLDAFIWNYGKGWLNQHIFKAIPNVQKIHKSYFFHLMKIAMLNMSSDKHGSAMQHVTNQIFGNFQVPLPSLSEQKLIADFLDEKCAEIDNLSEDIQKQIEILNDYKKSVITRAVTKGLDPNAEMKESGIDYLGKYPMNWKLSRVKFNLKEPMKYGATESGVEYSEDLPRYIRITDITSDNKLKDDGKLSLTWQQAKRYILSSDTVLFARSGGTVGKTFYYRPSYGKAAFAGYLISAIPNEKKMLTEWLYFYTLSNAYWEWANQIFTQATIQNIGADKYSNLPITAPDIETQKTIISYLTNRCSEIDESIALKQNQLDRLATYKKSIIYEYVTGKKRVKGAL